MPLLRLVALFLLFCLAAVAPGQASAHVRHSDTRSTAPTESSAFQVARPLGQHFAMVAASDQDDADCDGDGCVHGHCKHGCSCGCGMGACAGSCAAMTGLHSTLSWSGAKQTIASLIAQPAADARGTCPLRPPIV